MMGAPDLRKADFVALIGLFIVAVMSQAISASGCNTNTWQKHNTILLGLTKNMNLACIGHAQGLCGPEDEVLPTEIAGIFATEPDCRGLRLRGLTKQELGTPGNQLPLYFELWYVGRPHAEPYMGTGKGEDEGWMLQFNGPHGYFSAKVKTESDAVRRVCLATKGQGGEIDESVGSSH
jgi:hypothetical protein